MCHSNVSKHTADFVPTPTWFGCEQQFHNLCEPCMVTLIRNQNLAEHPGIPDPFVVANVPKPWH
jgi:hypothetical protein